MITAFGFELVRLLQEGQRGDTANIVLSSTFQIITMLTLSILIAPKALPAFYRRLSLQKDN